MNKALDFSSGLLQQIFTAKEPRRTEEASEQRGNGHFLLITLVMMAAYFLTGKLTFEMSHNTLSHMVVSIVVFLPEGFALAGAILFGRSVWLGVFLGQLLLAVSAGMPWAPALGISAVNSMEAVLAASLVTAFGLDKSLARVKDIAGLMLLVAFVLQPFSAFLGNSVLYAFSVVSSEDLVWSVFSWWFGNSVAQLLIAPMLVYLYVRRHELNIRNVSLVILFFVLLNYVLLYAMPVHRLALLLAITMPMVMLLAAYKGITYATIATTTIALSTIYATGYGFGAFASGSGVDDVIDINFYIVSHVFLVLFVGTILEENKQAHALVSRKNEVLQELVALQGQVESMNRHDMKNPLSVAINGPGVVLNTEPALSEGSRKLLEMARRSGYRVLDMINRSLDLYKLETGTYVLKPKKIDLREVLREVISQEKLSCEGEGNRQNFSLDTSMFKEDQGLWAYGEALLCHSIFSNLLRNAVDASPPGAPIAIQVGFCEASQMYKIGITNDGSVPADIQDSFFEKLVTRNKEKGTGFGTYSARLCVEVQGGKIALESAPGNKTRVVVWLPTWKEG